MSTEIANTAKRRRANRPNVNLRLDAASVDPTPDTAAVGLKLDAAAIPHDEVARRAYEKFMARGGTHGSDVDDWLEAEHELLAARSVES
jgi:Protein of unknown function (DUF2934)